MFLHRVTLAALPTAKHFSACAILLGDGLTGNTDANQVDSAKENLKGFENGLKTYIAA